MRAARVELARDCSQRLLRPMCLPIPPCSLNNFTRKPQKGHRLIFGREFFSGILVNMAEFSPGKILLYVTTGSASCQ